MNYKYTIHSPYGNPKTIEVVNTGSNKDCSDIDFEKEAKIMYGCLIDLPHATYMRLKELILNGGE